MPDSQPHLQLLNEARKAYRQDPSYVVQMVETATTLESRRAAWTARSQAKAS